jgi:hypothetical protein
MKDHFAAHDEVFVLRAANDNWLATVPRFATDNHFANENCDVPDLVGVDPFDDAITTEYVPLDVIDLDLVDPELT